MEIWQGFLPKIIPAESQGHHEDLVASIHTGTVLINACIPPMMIKDSGPIKHYLLDIKDIYNFVFSIYFMFII